MRQLEIMILPLVALAAASSNGQLVLFYLPDCAHNKPYHIHLSQTQTLHNLANQSSPTKVNCLQHQQFCHQLNLKYFPTLAVYSPQGLQEQFLPETGNNHLTEGNAAQRLKNKNVTVLLSNESQQKTALWVDTGRQFGKQMLKLLGKGFWRIQSNSTHMSPYFLGKNSTVPNNLTLHHRSSTKSELTYHNFKLKVLQSSKSVVVLFYDTECLLSAYSLHLLRTLKEEFGKQAIFYAYNLAFNDMPEGLSIHRIPVLQVWREGKQQSFEGEHLTKHLSRQWLRTKIYHV